MNTSPRILVVDDERNLLVTVHALLQQEGYEVTTADGGVAALVAIREHHYDLVLTDLKMPQVDGLAVLAEVRKRSLDTVTVMMTAHASVRSALDALKLGAYEYLLKPIGAEDLKAAVRRSLERKRLSEIDALYRVSRTLSVAKQPDQIKAEVAESVRNVLGLANATLVTIPARQDSVAVVEDPAGGISASDVDVPSGPSGTDDLYSFLQQPSVYSVLQRGGAVTGEGVRPEAASWASEAGIRSFVFIPGLAGERLVCVLCADNGGMPFEFHASALRFLQGLANQSALALENAFLITALKNNNEQLAAANRKLQEIDKLKSQFLSVATHELRTPLSVILGYNAMLAESLQDRLSPEEEQTLHESVAACRRLIRLVNSMLDITQIESGRMRMNLAIADLRQVANGVVSLFQLEARRKGIRLSLQMPLKLPLLLMDTERIEQVLVNLIGNALKFTERGSISVVIRQRRDSAIEVSVADTGIGISAAEQQTIFDEFAQVHSHITKRQREGSGLGLAIAKRIIEAHEGRITVISKPGKGSIFSFRIPLRGDASAVCA